MVKLEEVNNDFNNRVLNLPRPRNVVDSYLRSDPSWSILQPCHMKRYSWLKVTTFSTESEFTNCDSPEEIARLTRERDAALQADRSSSRSQQDVVIAIPKPKGEAGNSKNGFNLRESMGLSEEGKEGDYRAVLVRRLDFFPHFSHISKPSF